MLSVYSAKNQLHDPQQYFTRGALVPARESPQRAAELLAALEEGGHEVIAPRDFGRKALLAVHDADYIDFLETAYSEWMRLSDPKGPAVLAQGYAMRRMITCPTSFEGKIGYYLQGTTVPIVRESWASIRSAANCALEAADAVNRGAREAYALCRPPGHHAYADLAGGYCYVNNAALAAEHLRGRFSRVAILDVDVHHGNGTQGIFWKRGDVFVASLHADPNNAYPWYVGYATERGEGDGNGTTLNLPLPVGTGDADYLSALDKSLRDIVAYAPEALVVSLGLDAFIEDSSKLMCVTEAGFHAIGARIGAARLPTTIVQEGGYAVGALRRLLEQFLAGFLSTRVG